MFSRVGIQRVPTWSSVRMRILSSVNTLSSKISLSCKNAFMIAVSFTHPIRQAKKHVQLVSSLLASVLCHTQCIFFFECRLNFWTPKRVQYIALPSPYFSFPLFATTTPQPILLLKRYFTMKSIGVTSVVDANKESTAFSGAVREGDTGAIGMSGLQDLQLVFLDLGGRLVGGGRRSDLDLGLVGLLVRLALGLGLGLIDDGLNWGWRQELLLLLWLQIVRGLGRELYRTSKCTRQRGM